MAPSVRFYQLQEPLSLNQTTNKNQRFLKERQLLVIGRMLPRLRLSDYVTMTRTCKQGNNEGCYILQNKRDLLIFLRWQEQELSQFQPGHFRHHEKLYTMFGFPLSCNYYPNSTFLCTLEDFYTFFLCTKINFNRHKGSTNARGKNIQTSPKE